MIFVQSSMDEYFFYFNWTLNWRRCRRRRRRRYRTCRRRQCRRRNGSVAFYFKGVVKLEVEKNVRYSFIGGEILFSLISETHFVLVLKLFSSFYSTSYLENNWWPKWLLYYWVQASFGPQTALACWVTESHKPRVCKIHCLIKINVH